MSFHPDTYSASYNSFRDYVVEFLEEFTSQRDFTIAETITNLLIKNSHLHIDDPEHPLNRYADIDLSRNEIIRKIKNDVLNQLHDAVKVYIYLFFHSGGVYYEMFTDLVDEFLDWADKSYIEHEASPNDFEDEDEYEPGDPNNPYVSPAQPV